MCEFLTSCSGDFFGRVFLWNATYALRLPTYPCQSCQLSFPASTFSPLITGQISTKADRGKVVSDMLNSYEVSKNKKTDKRETFTLWEY